MRVFDPTDEMEFVVVKGGDTLSKIIQDQYSVSSSTDINRHLENILKHNPHITNADQIYPGQVISLGTVDSAYSGFHSPHSQDLRDMELELRRLSLPEQQAFFALSEDIAILDKAIESSDATTP